MTATVIYMYNTYEISKQDLRFSFNDKQNQLIILSLSNHIFNLFEYFQTIEHIPKQKSGIEFAHLWNKAVDQALGPVIKSLGSRGW